MYHRVWSIDVDVDVNVDMDVHVRKSTANRIEQ